ncbi:prephenate dehydratase [Thermostilla marina]
MAKKKAAKRSSSSRGATPATLARKLKSLDQQLVKLLNERAKVAEKLARQRREAGEQPFVLAEEDRLLSEIRAAARGPLDPDAVQAVFRELLSGCRALVQPLRVAFLGPLYSYSHLAAVRRFGNSVEFLPVATIATVFEEVQRKHATYGIVPLENSTDGRIADTLEMFTRVPLRICGQVDLEIHHALLARCPRSEIHEIYSKPQAMSQCRNWLAKHVPAARMIEVTSTTTAAQLAAEKPGAAAIASVEAGKYYGLDVLAEAIEDNPNNSTRFAVIGGEVPPRTGRDKTALMFQVEHKPGALADAMNIFKRNKLNLTWIESFPIRDCKGAYLFFVEFQGHENDLRVRRALESLGRKTLRLEVLGAYPAGPKCG